MISNKVMNDRSMDVRQAETRTTRDWNPAWTLGYIVPWVVILGGAWCAGRIGATLHWWHGADTDLAIRNMLLHSFIEPLGILGLVVLPILAWPRVHKGQNETRFTGERS